jgi:hypothetical protein
VGVKIIGWGGSRTLTSPGPSSMVAFIGYVFLSRNSGLQLEGGLGDAV